MREALQHNPILHHTNVGVPVDLRCRSPRQSLGLVSRQSLGLVTRRSLGPVSRQSLGLVPRQFLGLVTRMFPSLVSHSHMLGCEGHQGEFNDFPGRMLHPTCLLSSAGSRVGRPICPLTSAGSRVGRPACSCLAMLYSNV